MTLSLEMLTKPHWNCNDVMAYVGCKKSKAYQIMARCKKHYGGAIPFETSYVTRDSVLNYLKTDIDRELYIYERSANEEKLLQEKV